MNTTTQAEAYTALQSAIAALNVVAAAFAPEEPASTITTTPAPEATCTCTEEKRCSACFVTWVRDTAEARKARKSSNADMAAWMRSKGLVPNGSAWELAKKGERSVVTLRKANAADKAAKA